MDQKKVIWAVSAAKAEKIWHIGTTIAANSALKVTPPYPVRVIVRVKDDKGKVRYNIGTLSRVSDGKCEVNLFPNGAPITASLGVNEEVRLWPDIDWFWKKMFDEEAIKIKDFSELTKYRAVIVKLGNAENGFCYKPGKVVALTDKSVEIDLNNGRIAVKHGHESRVRLWE